MIGSVICKFIPASYWLVHVPEVTVTDREVSFNSTTTLTCTAKGLSDDVTFEWTNAVGEVVSGTTGARSGDTQSSTITVTALSETTYTCGVRSRNTWNKITKTANLKVFSK